MEFKAPKRKIVKIVSALAVCLWVSPAFAFAYKLLQDLPTNGGLKSEMNLSDYLTWLFHFALAAAAFLAVLKIVIGAMNIIVGGASETAITKGKEMIKMALWGLLLAVSSVLILTAINPDLVKTGLIIDPVETETNTTGESNGGANQIVCWIVDTDNCSCKQQTIKTDYTSCSNINYSDTKKDCDEIIDTVFGCDF